MTKLLTDKYGVSGANANFSWSDYGMTTTFKLGSKSIAELKDVHPDLVRTVKRAIQLTTQDFRVNDGTRTIEEQRKYVKLGYSKTMKSRHLIQKDGLGYAVDLAPYIAGKVLFEWAAIWPIAVAMAKAAKELGVELTWGAVWDRKMSDFLDITEAGLKREVEAYKKRHAGSDFLDGPHYQLVK